MHGSDVADAYDLTLLAAFDDDVCKLFRFNQPPLGGNDNLKVRSRRGRLLSDNPGGNLLVLFLNGQNHVICSETESGELAWIKPDPHGILVAHQINAADAVESGESVLDLEKGVVAEIEFVSASVR